MNLTGSGSCTTTSGGSTCSSFTIAGTTFWQFAGALWSVNKVQPTVAGYIDSFVRIQDLTAGRDVVDGMNSSGTRRNDELAGTFTKDVTTSSIATTTIAGQSYYQFLLDINQEAGDPLLSLSGLELCQAQKGGLSFVDSCAGGAGVNKSTAKYDLDGTPGTTLTHTQTQAPVNNVLLDYSKNKGSGSGDLFVYIPAALLPKTAGNEYVYLWSQFGLPSPYANNAGYEEWAYRNTGVGTADFFNQATITNPEPGSLILLGTGLLVGGNLLRRRKLKKQAQAIV